MLSLMLLPLFSSNESLCLDPITTHIITLVAGSVVTYSTSKIIEKLDSSPEKQMIEMETRERLDFIDAKIKFKKCVTDSKPEDEKTKTGIPVQCKELARTFLACGGKEEIIKIIMDLEDFGD